MAHINFIHLTNTHSEVLRETFNLAFADYIINLQLTKEQFENKLIADDIDLSLSIGAFNELQLVGFILHGYRQYGQQKLAFNAGTGVIPAFRGRHLTQSMYQHVLPALRARGITSCSLEVITKNLPAFKTYSHVGFVIKRELTAFRGNVLIEHLNTEWLVTETDLIDYNLAQSFWDWQPSWQNNIRALENLGKKNKTLTVQHEDKLIAYVSYNPLNNRIIQFAVKPQYRRKGIATAIFKYIAQHYAADIILINIEKKDTATIRFINSIGLQPFLEQLEMELELKQD